MAEAAGFEPATLPSTGECSSQLSYASRILQNGCLAWTRTMSFSVKGRSVTQLHYKAVSVVVAEGFEPST